MKKILLTSLIATLSALQCFSKVHLDLEIEKLLRQDGAAFTQECKKCENSLHKKFPVTIIGEIHEKNLNQIPLGSINQESYYQSAWNIAHEIIAEMEHYEDYQATLKTALEQNTEIAWNHLIHEVVYYHTRVLTQKKSDLIFPSLEHNDGTKEEKIQRFCQANFAINPEKNAPYLAATSFVLYSFKQLQKNYQAEKPQT